MHLSKRNGWFYIIQLSYNGIWGFGITRGIEHRLRNGYCNPSCSKQEFSHLYYGDYTQITEIERHLKNEWREYRHSLFSGNKLEWIDPKFDITGDDIKSFCENRIYHYPHDKVFSVKAEHLPYSPGKYFKTINDEPESFLEEVKKPLTTGRF
jgi:hypothetical protein